MSSNPCKSTLRGQAAKKTWRERLMWHAAQTMSAPSRYARVHARCRFNPIGAGNILSTRPSSCICFGKTLLAIGDFAFYFVL